MDIETDTVRRILQTALDTPLEGIENPTRGEIEVWDSLTHLEVVFMLEEEFDLRFTEEEIVELRSLTEIVALLGDKHEA